MTLITAVHILSFTLFAGEKLSFSSPVFRSGLAILALEIISFLGVGLALLFIGMTSKSPGPAEIEIFLSRLASAMLGGILILAVWGSFTFFLTSWLKERKQILSLFGVAFSLSFFLLPFLNATVEPHDSLAGLSFLSPPIFYYSLWDRNRGQHDVFSSLGGDGTLLLLMALVFTILAFVMRRRHARKQPV